MLHRSGYQRQRQLIRAVKGKGHMGIGVANIPSLPRATRRKIALFSQQVIDGMTWIPNVADLESGHVLTEKYANHSIVDGEYFLKSRILHIHFSPEITNIWTVKEFDHRSLEIQLKLGTVGVDLVCSQAMLYHYDDRQQQYILIPNQHELYGRNTSFAANMRVHILIGYASEFAAHAGAKFLSFCLSSKI